MNHRNAIYAGLVFTVLMFGLWLIPYASAGYWHNVGAISLVQQLMVNESSHASTVDTFVATAEERRDIPQWESAMNELEKAVWLNPNDARAYYLLFTAYWQVGHMTKIISHFDLSDCQQCKGDVLLLFLAGAAHYQQGNIHEAQQTWQLSPNLDVPLMEIGFRFLRAEEREKSYEFWEIAELVNPTPKFAKARMYKYMCERSFRFQEWSEAERWCRQWHFAESDLRAPLFLAHALIGLNDIESAAELVAEVQEFPNVSLTRIIESHIFWLQARIAAAEGNWQLAIDRFEDAVALTPENSLLYLHYATALVEAGSHERAKLMLDKATLFDNGALARQIDQLRIKVQ